MATKPVEEVEHPKGVPPLLQRGSSQVFAKKMEDSAKAAADDRHDEVPRRAAAAPSLGRLPSPRAAALVACTLLASWALGQLLLVAPAPGSCGPCASYSCRLYPTTQRR